jgi:5-methylcytosine-specific restriction enzyme A
MMASQSIASRAGVRFGKPRDRRFYDDPRWIRMSKAHLRWHPYCNVEGCSAFATDVDHIIPIVLAPQRALDPTNIQSLCKRHHSRLTRAFDAGSLRGACNVAGDPEDPSHPWLQPTHAEAIRVVNAPRPPSPARLAARLKQQTVRGHRR